VAWLGAEDEVTPEDVLDEVTEELAPESEDAEPVSEDAEPVSEDAEPVSEDAEPVSEDAEPVSEDVEPSADEPVPEVEELASEPDDFLADEPELAVEEVRVEVDTFWALVALALSLVADPFAGAMACMNTARPSVEAVTPPKIALRARESRLSAAFLRCAPSWISLSRLVPEVRFSGLTRLRFAYPS
jgi:hypothetical protein